MKTSPKKSAPAKTKSKALKTGGIGDYEVVIETPADQQIASLQESLAKERDDRLEERFANRAVISILVLVLASPQIAPLAWPLVSLLYIAGLILYAKRCGLDDVVVILSAIWSRIMKEKKD